MKPDWSEILGGIILFLIGLASRGLGFGFSVRSELNALKVSDETMAKDFAALKLQIHDMGTKLDNLAQAVNTMQGFMQGQAQGSAK